MANRAFSTQASGDMTMSLDKKVSEAIHSAVQDADQSDAVARRLIAWMEAVTSGNEDIHDRAAAARHLEQLYAETDISVNAGESQP